MIWTKYHEEGYRSGLKKPLDNLNKRIAEETDEQKKLIMKEIAIELQKEIKANGYK